MKKIFYIFMLVFSAITLVACLEDEVIEISVNKTSLALNEGETEKLVVTTNDEAGYTVSVEDSSIASISEDLTVSAVAHGSTKIIFTAKSDETKTAEVTVTVSKIVNVNLSAPDGVLWVGMTFDLEFEANDELTFQSSNTNVATVSSTGLVALVGAGEATITATSKLDPEVSDSITLNVLDLAQGIAIQGVDKGNVGTKRTLSVVAAPENAVVEVEFSSSDETLATVSSTGEVTFLKPGVVTISAVYAFDESLVATKEIEIVDIVVVDASKQAGDVVTVDGLDIVFGEKLFESIDDAQSAFAETSVLYLNAGTYGAFTINDDVQSVIFATGVIFEDKLTIDKASVTIENIKFLGNGHIEATKEATNLVIRGNHFEGLNQDAITIIESNGLVVESNTFKDFAHTALVIQNLKGGRHDAQKNLIQNIKLAVDITGTEYDNTASLYIQRNDIQNVVSAFDIKLAESAMTAIIRFNAVTGTSKLAKANRAYIDFTMNYWGQQELDLNKFEGIPERMLLGHYKTKNAIPSEASYNPAVPTFIFVTNPIEEIYLGTNYKLEWEYLPYELNNARFRVLTTDAKLLLPNDAGYLTPVKSGLVTITIRSANAATINTTLQISVTTDPGIDIVPEEREQSLVVGDKLQLNSYPFPYTYANEQVTYESLNTNIATVNEAGLVTGLAEGEVIIRARLVNEYSVYADYVVTFYESLDENNLLDLLTLNQMAFTKEFRYMVIGTGTSYENIDYESVSKYYFENNMPINTDKMVPVSNGIRPGTKKPAHPEGITTYNPQNVYWLVIHDTANNAPGSGALSHANYLWNAAAAGTVLNTSWTYTMDDEYLYQHVPEDEVSYHAGDGSTLPGQSTNYLGGGNRNGIAIEMSVAQDDDIWRVWQRTAKFATNRMVYYNLPRSHFKFHRDFSGKNCPNTLLTAGLANYFQEMADIEYKIWSEYANAQIDFVSHNTDILDHHGRIIAKPDHATAVSYTISVNVNGSTQQRTFTVNVPGTMR